MTFRDPAAFWLLLPVLASLVWIFVQRRGRSPTLVIGHGQLFKALSPGLRTRWVWLPKALLWAAVVLSVVALARPQRADVRVNRNVEGIDIVIALDVSDSMLIEDMKPVNRLEASKKTIREFIERRVSDRIGLVVFSGEAYTRVPPTLDYPVLLESVAAVETSRNIKMGTAIGVALAVAVERLKKSTAKNRVIIFLTDGENNSGTIDPETALDIAVDAGVKIYAIGAGRDGLAQLPQTETDAFGRKFKRYRPMQSKVNDDLLGRFASQTGGRYFRASTGAGLDKIFAEINELEKSKIQASTYTRFEELYGSYLFPAIVLFVLGLLLQSTLLRRGP
jgi:Ca-activated chloride channel family protein